MASLCLKQSQDYLNIGVGTSPYRLVEGYTHLPSNLPKHITEHLITDELRAAYASLRQAEADAVRARKNWLTELASSLVIPVQEYVENYRNTHPEEFL